MVDVSDLPFIDAALCAAPEYPPALFFPRVADPGDPAVLAAKAVCAMCPAAGDCLDHAITNREREGVWGGFTADERAAIVRRSRRARVPVSVAAEHVRSRPQQATPAARVSELRAG